MKKEREKLKINKWVLFLSLLFLVFGVSCRGIQFAKQTNSFAGGRWCGTTTIDAGDRDAKKPSIAISSNNEVIAVFCQRDEKGTFRVWANHFKEGIWCGAAIIDAGSGETNCPQVAIGPNNEAIAVFCQNNRIYANHFRKGVWSGAVIIDAGTGEADSPQIAISPNNEAIAVFSQKDALGRHCIYASHFKDDKWANPTVISAGGGGWAKCPKIAIMPNNEAIAVFEQQKKSINGVKDRIYANYFKDGCWLSPTIIDASPGDAGNPKIAINSNNEALVVFDYLNGSIYANIFKNGKWLGPTVISGTKKNVDEQQIAVGSSNEGIVIFREDISSIWGIVRHICVTWFKDGKWSEPNRITSGEKWFDEPNIAIGPITKL